ncbi:hypothetical protein ARSQ2_00635 [Arsenophonus endosymbiont of Bemisia tabaci Q2]|nr:hypothetical protein [Arsenophonus endosymbiont of Bemisia tabaci]CAA2929538.1 hypothetical protein ARSQ2_00635 [Arsenophonus endosymbiont of Bemisia tabaci Q2]
MLSDYLISILTAMFSMHGCIQVLIPVLPKNSVIMMDNATFHKKRSIEQVIIDARGIWWNICLPIRQILIQLNINGHKLNAKKSARMRHRYFVRTRYGVIKIKSLSYIANCYYWLNIFRRSF